MPSDSEPASQSLAEKLPKERKGIVVGQINNIDIIRPKTLAQPLIEGTHLQVRLKEQQKSWYGEQVKPLLKTAFFSLPTAKTIVHAEELPDLWANVHFNSRPFLDKGMNVYGRSPHSENGLGKPVYMREIEEEEQLDASIIQKLRTRFSEILPYWNDLYRQMNLFPDGFSLLPEVSTSYQDEVKKFRAQNEQVLLVTDKNTIVNVGNPHVQGLHLVVHSRSSYWQKEGNFRGWEFPVTPKQVYLHIQGFLEMCSLLIGLEQILLQDAKLPFYHPEIHFSGNWGVKKDDLREAFSGSDEEWLTYVRSEKYKQRVWAGEEWAITNHGHLYATDTKGKFVHLPRRPFGEMGLDWQNISPLGQEDVRTVAEMIRTKLPEFILDHAAGYMEESNLPSPTTENTVSITPSSASL